MPDFRDVTRELINTVLYEDKQNELHVKLVSRPKKSIIPFISTNKWTFNVYHKHKQLFGTISYNEDKNEFTVENGISIRWTKLRDKCLEEIANIKLEEELYDDKK